MSSPRSRWRRPPRTCRRILDAEARTGRRVDVAFNYRFAPTARRIRSFWPRAHRRDRLGRFPLVSRYQARRRLFPPLACLQAALRQPVRAQGDASLRPAELVDRRRSGADLRAAARCASYGAAGPFRGVRCKACPHADACEFYLDIGADPWLEALYEAPSEEDGYFRDACVFREDIDIPDTMSAAIRYENGVQVVLFAQHLHADRGLSPRLQRHEGRIEMRKYEKQAWEAPHGRDEILRSALTAGRADLGRARAGRAFRRRPGAAPDAVRAGGEDPLSQRAGAGPGPCRC